MRVTSRTEPTVNYEEGQNITKKNHKINNVTPWTNNTVYIDKPERVKPNS